MKFWSLRDSTSFDGSVHYERVREFQLSLVEKRAQDLIPDTVLFLEHQPVVTQGRGLQFTGVERPRHTPVPQNLPTGTTFSETERGGDLTWHGPGQLVIYPICKMDGQGFAGERDVAGFLRKIEAIMIAELAFLGLKASAHENATGVWIGTRKIASMGIAVRKWVTYHGIALNVVNDLSPFHLISPCGFDPEVMTRLSDLVDLDDDWRQPLETRLAQRFQRDATVESREI